MNDDENNLFDDEPYDYENQFVECCICGCGIRRFNSKTEKNKTYCTVCYANEFIPFGPDENQ